MAIVSRATLKSWFKRLAKPTEAQFASLFDSFVHKDEDAVAIEKISDLEDALEEHDRLLGVTEEIVCTGITEEDPFYGFTVPVGFNLTQFIKKDKQRVVHPVYDAPLASLLLNLFTVEVGSVLNTHLEADWSQNDAGDIVGLRFYRGATLLDEFAAGALEWETDDTDGIAISEGAITYRLEVDHEDGPVKVNNLGENDNVGQILENTIEIEKSVVGKYRVFAIAEAGNVIVQDIDLQDFARTHNKVGVIWKGSAGFSLDVSDAKTVGIICPPGVYLDLVNTKNPSTNEAVMSGVVSEDVLIPCAGTVVQDYKLYLKTWDAAWPDGNTFNVVLT